MGVRTSPIWHLSRQEFLQLITTSGCIGEALRKLGLRNIGQNPSTLKKRLIEENMASEIDRLVSGGRQRVLEMLREYHKRIPLEEILVENSTYSRYHLKRRLIAEGILVEQCAVCGLVPYWNDKPLTLVLDHYNGINNDNRLDNLRLLCPNCNSQTATFTGRNARYPRIV